MISWSLYYHLFHNEAHHCSPPFVVSYSLWELEVLPAAFQQGFYSSSGKFAFTDELIDSFASVLAKGRLRPVRFVRDRIALGNRKLEKNRESDAGVGLAWPPSIAGSHWGTRPTTRRASASRRGCNRLGDHSF